MIRDRVKELRRVPAGSLRPNPKNWRRHPKSQANALRGSLSGDRLRRRPVGRETADGLQLIDGRLRAETTPDATVPVLVLDVTEAEADKLLLTLDPLAATGRRGHRFSPRSSSRRSRPTATPFRGCSTASRRSTGAQPGPKPLDDPGPKFDEAEALRKKWGVESGQLWTLGEHRLMCGDATKAVDVARLLRDEGPSCSDGSAPRGVGRTRYGMARPRRASILLARHRRSDMRSKGHPQHVD